MPHLPLVHANIIEILGLQNLPEKERIKIVADSINLIETRALNQIISILDKDKQEELTEILDKEDEVRLYQFLGDHKIDIISIVEQETEQLKQELKNDLADIL